MVAAITPRPVTGIFEASISMSLAFLRANEQFGIVSTGKVWEKLLGDATGEYLGGSSEKFVGVETTGLNATELHDAPREEVERRVKDAVGRMLGKGREGGGEVKVVVLGCAGMVGMETWVRDVVGEGVKVVDGVKAGVGVLQGLVRGSF
jgi:Asp/Glu/hydantoin racemase